MDDCFESDMIAEFEERIAIMMVDGEAKERDAVRHAYAELRRRYGPGKMPEHVKRRMREVMEAMRMNYGTSF